MNHTKPKLMKMTAQRIKSLRREKKMTQTELACKIGVSRSVLACWENGTRLPGTLEFECLSLLFDVPIDYILGISSKRFNINKPKQFELDLTKLNRWGVQAIYDYYLLLLNSEKYRRNIRETK